MSVGFGKFLPRPIRSPWASFISQYGMEVRIRRDKILALHQGNFFTCKVAGKEYEGPVTFIEYAPTCGEDGTGVTVRGSLQEVMEVLS